MATRDRFNGLTLAFLMAHGLAGAAHGASTVLTLRAGPVATASWPLSTGVPFPRGALTSLDNLRLEDGAAGAGKEVPAQFSTLATWHDRSLKSVLVTLAAPIATSGTTTYTLHYGAGVTRTPVPAPLTLAEDSAAITVTTGPLKLQLDKARFGLFSSVWLDRDGDGQYDTAEKLVDTPGDLYVVDAFSGKEFRSSLFASPSWTILERGPLRAVVRAQGQLQASDGKKLTEFRVWITAWAGSPNIAVDYTLADPRDEVNVEANRAQLALSLSAWGIRIPTALPSPTYAFGLESDGVSTAPVTATHALSQAGRMNFVDGVLQPYDFSYTGVATGGKIPGWFDLSGGGAGVAVLLRDCWQNFPKRLSVQGSTMHVELHPAEASLPQPDLAYPPLSGTTKRWERPNTFYAPREGAAKTYQLLFAFHVGGAGTAKAQDLNKLFQLHRLLLTASAPWYAQSEVFGKIVEAGPWSAGYDQYQIDGHYEPAVTPFVDSGGYMVQYGWCDYGDHMRGGWAAVSPEGVRIPAWYNDTHIGMGHNFLVQYLRTLDERWFKLGEVATRHFMDRDVSHASRTGYWPKAYGPGEVHAINHNVTDHNSKVLHTGHAHMSGLPDLWLLTGDWRAREVLEEIGSWWINSVPVFFPVPIQKPHTAEASRDFGRPLFTMTEAYRATGDPKYLRAAARLVKHLLAWWQDPQPHLQDAVAVGTHDWTKGTGWITMSPRCDNCPTGWNGTSGPWMDGDLMYAMIQFLDMDRPYKYVNDALVEEFLLQILDYDVKWAWVDPPGYFAYSESTRAIDGGPNMLYYPLAYLWALRDSGAGMNPKWYTTSATWKQIAKAAYLDWKVVKARGTNSGGWYGYEFFPTQFFQVMRDLELKGKL